MGRGAGEVGMGRRRGGGNKEGGKSGMEVKEGEEGVTLSEVGSKLTGKICLEFRKVFPSP